MTTSRQQTKGDSVTLDELFDCLGHATRRRVVASIASEAPRDVTEFDPPDSVSPDAFRRGLYHTHLPRLDEASIVDWNPEANLVRRGERFADVEPVVDLFDEYGERLPAAWP